MEMQQINQNFNQLASAAFYFIASFIASIVTNDLLSLYGFPAFQLLAVGQNVTIVLCLYAAKKSKLVEFPDVCDRGLPRLATIVLPYCAIRLINMIMTLGAWKELSLPLYAALRSLALVFITIFEILAFDRRPSSRIWFAVCLIVFGAMVANNDVNFYERGYTFGLLSILSTSVDNVYAKKLLETPERQECPGVAKSATLNLNVFGLLFYTSLLSIVPGLFVAYETGEFQTGYRYELWHSGAFRAQFAFACATGFAHLCGVAVCIQQNSAATTAGVGCAKNVCMICLGLDVGRDNVYAGVNALGVGACAIGCFVHFCESSRAACRRDAPASGV